MKIAMTGSSGLVGSELVRRFEAAGQEVVRIRHGAESDPNAQWNPEAGWLREGVLDGVEAVVHLAGTSIDKGRWSASHQESIRRSRIDGARLLVDAIRAMPEEARPKVFVTSSAVGYYGDRGDERLTEGSARGEGFLADVCADWEAEAFKAEELGVRVVAVRGGVIIRSLFRLMLLPFKLGLGGNLGNGRQWFAWATLEDTLRVYEFVVGNDSISGPVNAVGPQEVTNAEFTKAMGRALRRPTLFPVPGFGIKLIMGGEKAEETALVGQRVAAQALVDAGFEFLYSGIDEAVRAELAGGQ